MSGNSQSVHFNGNRMNMKDCSRQLYQGDDLIFFAAGSQIKALSNKGKEIYSFDTFLAENIRVVLVHGYKLWVIGDSLLNEFEMGQPSLMNKSSRKANANQKTRESNYYLSEDHINSAYLYYEEATSYCVILRDNCQIQLIDRGEVLAFLKTDSVPQCCSQYTIKDNANLQKKQTNIIGLSSGNVICVEISLGANRKRILKKQWQIVQPGNKCLSVLETFKGVLVCRSNQLEIWSKTQEDTFELRWQKQSQQAIVECILLQSTNTIMYSTFTGKLTSIDILEGHQPRKKPVAKEQDLRGVLESFTKQVDLLEEQHQKLRAVQSAKMGAKIQKYRLTHTVTLNPSLQSYNLQISCSLPITRVIFDGNVILKTDKTITFNGQDKSGVFKYVVQLEGELNPSFDYSVRQGSETTLSCYFHLKGDKDIVVCLPIEIKALCMHIKIDNKLPAGFKNRKDLNKFVVSGKFTRIDMNAWLSSIMQVPKSVSDDSQTVFVHESTLTRQKLITQFSQDEAVFLAECLTPLLIIKRILAKKSKERQANIKFRLQPNPLSIEQTLKSIQPKMLEYEKIQKQFKILPGLLEVSTQEQGSEVLSQRFKSILANQTQIRVDYEKNRRFYEQMRQSVMELYTSYQAARDLEVSEFQRENLTKKLLSFKLEQILSIITG